MHTFKGVLAGREDTRGRFNLTDGGVEGVVYAPEGWVYVEPLRNYLPGAPAGELVVYRHSDIKPGEALKCGVSLPKRLQQGVEQVTAQVEAATPTKYEFDIATEADYEYVQALGGSVAANREIEGILNQVEGVYQSELLLQLRISYQNAWGIADDPYTATNARDLLREFTEYWNANYLHKQDYDLAHLWTARERDDRSVGGIAWNRAVCSFRTFSYGLSTRQAGVPGKYVTPAHEIGHNFGAVHPDQINPPISTCVNTLMNGATLGTFNAQLTFCQFSRQQIAEYVAGNNICLVAQDITLQPPSGLTARARSTSGIDLAWQDSSVDETGFIVQRRREYSGVWVEAGTTAANTGTFSDGGLFSEATYIYRLQAYNDEEYSAFSNEAVATTLAGAPPDTDWIINTIAGKRVGDEDNGAAGSARLDRPLGVAVDSAGNIYIADTGNQRIRRVDTKGTITTVAGAGRSGYGGDGGPAAKAQLSFPNDVAVDGAGNLYISDDGNHRIRRVDTGGTITTVAGTGRSGYGGDRGPAVEARLDEPLAVAVDGAGNLYIADAANHRIRRVDTKGTITTVAGTGRSGYGGDKGPAARARLSTPSGVAVDGAGNLYIADYGDHRIRRVNALGIITTVAGTGEKGYSGDGGSAVRARLDRPLGMTVDGAGNLYISDHGNQRIRRVDTRGIIRTVAGTGRSGYGGDGGPAVKAQVLGPNDVAVDGSGILYIADTWNYRIRRVDGSGTITTIAGIGESGYSGDGGPAVAARLYEPADVAVDGAGNLYIADSGNHRIRRVDPEGIITTVAGTGTGGHSGDGGPAVAAQLFTPRGVAVDGSGTLYIADTLNHRIRRVDLEGIITTVTAKVYYPSDVVVDGSGNVYIADEQNSRILRVDGSGNHTIVAGTGKGGFSGDGGSAVTAQVWLPKGVDWHGAGNLYIADSSNRRIRRVDPVAIITTVAGTGRQGHSGDRGPAVAAALSHPVGVASDRSGNLYITDQSKSAIRQVDEAGIITTIAGTGFLGFSGDGGSAVEAELDRPRGIAVDNAGNIYVADYGNHFVRVLTQAPRYPTRLRAVGASPYEINLSWQNNSSSETGFDVQRRLEGSADWVEIGTTPAGTTRFSDGGLVPATRYHYRVRAFNNAASSTFSNEASATTHVLLPPTVTGFTPTQGPLGTRVTLTGTYFLGATDVRFNRVSAVMFEVVSATSIVAVVPPGATSGPISVVTPGGTAVSAEPFTVVFPPTLTGFTPTTGPAGTRVTLTGTHFLDATDIRFNRVSAVMFEVVSGTSIEAVVPPGATSGPISVVAPGGTAVSAEYFTVTTGIGSRLFVPIVLRAPGRTPGSLFTSELTLTNRGSTAANIHYTYRASFGGGSGTAVDSLEPGRQRIVPDAIAYLTSLGVPIGEGAAGGTLVVEFSNLSSQSDAAVTVRTSTPVEDGGGQAGLAYLGVTPEDLLTGTSVIAGLRQNRMDRSNVAVQNAGDASDGAITLRVTVYSGDPEAPGSLVLPELSLSPGGFHQYNGILAEAGFENGYVKVERVSGTAAYYAYGVINDNFNSDGSFVFPVNQSSLADKRGQALPVIVETRDFTSELTVTNFSESARTLDLRFVAEAVETGGTASFSLTLQAGEQSILPNLVDHLRGQEVAGIGPAGRAFAGALFARVSEGDMSGIVIGARTGSPGGGGQYGVFYNAVPDGSASTGSAWIYGLQQNATNRSNLALVNTGEVDEGDSLFSLDIYDGETGRLVKTVTTKAIPARGWHQINSILGDYARGTQQGYVRIRKLSGSNPFLAYGVINDGGAPGERSGDGTFLPSQ